MYVIRICVFVAPCVLRARVDLALSFLANTAFAVNVMDKFQPFSSNEAILPAHHSPFIPSFHIGFESTNAYGKNFPSYPRRRYGSSHIHANIDTSHCRYDLEASYGFIKLNQFFFVSKTRHIRRVVIINATSASPKSMRRL